MAWPDMAQSVFQNCVETFRTDATYRSTSRNFYYPARGIFNARYLSVEIRDGLEYSTVRPALDVSLAQLETVPTPGDEIIIGEVTYRISDIQFDGEGAALLILEKT